MNLPINHNDPTIMHVDLNSCFATIEQQLMPSLRDKPLVIAAYDSPNGCVVAPSICAKRYGVKTGMTVRDARLLCRNIIVHTPDPPLIRHAHLLFRKVLKDYSPVLVPKSIDEIVIDFTDTLAYKRGLVEIGREIKRRIREEVGEYVSCNIGISTNRFLAKLAASLHKPDGLDVIDHRNLEDIYAKVTLMDLNGINTRFTARLNAYGILNPIDFLNAPVETLQHKVFKSICGYHWYVRIRGFEVDDVEFGRKSFGQSYALKEQTNEPRPLYQYLMKLTEKMGRRLRRNGYMADGIHIGLVYTDLTYWHMGRLFHTPMYTTQDLYTKALLLLNRQPIWKKVREIGVSCYDLIPAKPEQQSLFDEGQEEKKKLQEAIDAVNDTYGEQVLTPGLMMGMKDSIVDRVSFGGVKELEDIYATH